MFHTLLTSAYILPSIYLFFRIGKLFINRGYRFLYGMIYLLIFLIYPISNFFGEDSSSGIIVILRVVSNYLLPFFLYVFLLILLYDLFLLLNFLLKFIPRDKREKPGYKFAALSAILSAAVLIVIAGVINFNTIRISEYNISIPAKASRPGNLKIAFVSDFHLQNRTDPGFVKKFVRKIDEINPDLMLFGGDIVEGDRDDGNLSEFEKYLSGIKTKYGVYGVLGNHEHYARQDKGSFFSKAGIMILNDTVISIDSSFCLAGRRDSHSSERMDINGILSSVKDSFPVILVDHRPTDIENVSRSNVDVQLSGHTHNGQLFPINLITRKVYRLSWGYGKIGKTHFFVSSGIRLWGPPVRTTGKSEIIVVNVRKI